MKLSRGIERKSVQSIRAKTFSLFAHSLCFCSPQVVYFTEMHKIFSELTNQIDQAGLTDEQRKRETEAKLSELRGLSIVADDWGRKAEKPGKGSFHASLNGLFSTEAPSGSKFQMDKIWLSSHLAWCLNNPSLNSPASCPWLICQSIS